MKLWVASPTSTVGMVANQAAKRASSTFVVSIDDEEITQDGAESTAVVWAQQVHRATRFNKTPMCRSSFGETHLAAFAQRGS